MSWDNRGRFLAVVAAVAVLTSVVVAGQLTLSVNQSPNAPAQPPIEIRFDGSRHGIWLQCQVNGSQAGWFLLDTGAQASVIDEAVAKRLGLAVAGSATAFGTGPSGVRANYLRPVTIRIGDLDLPLQPLVSVPLPVGLSEEAGRPIAGVLGSSLIAQIVVTVDSARGEFVLYDRSLKSGPDTVPLVMHDDRPFVELELSLNKGSRLRGEFMLDTAANSGLDINRWFLVSHKVEELLRQPRIQTVGFGIGGRVEFAESRIDGIQLGQWTIKMPILSRPLTADGSGAIDAAGVLGYTILRRFAITLDYRSKLARFKPNGTLGSPFESDMSGMVLAARGHDLADVTVLHVRDDSPAAEVGIVVGDILVSIDGRPTAKIGLDAVTDLFRRHDRKYTLTILRKGRVLPLNLRTRRAI